MIGFQIHLECMADKVCGFADGSLMWCEKNEGSDDFRSKQLVVTIYGNVEACKRSLVKQIMTTFRCVEIPLKHSGEDIEEAIM